MDRSGLERPFLPNTMLRRNSQEPIYDQFASLKNREESFSYYRWPVQMKQQPKDMALAGFVYTGCNDSVMCFCCGNGVYNWETNDEPFEEHAHLHPECTYLKMMKSPGFIRRAKTLCKEQPKSVHQIEQTIETKDKSSESIDVSNECVLCLSQEKTVAFIPCGHLSACVECSFQVKICPVCRQSITSRHRIYK